MSSYDVVIVGAGHAGAMAAATLRQQKFAGSIAVIGDEPELPYNRPPLSKEYMSGDKSFEQILLRPEKFWQQAEVDFLLGNKVTAVDASAHSLSLANGDSIGYGKLIWATGGSPRRLPLAGADAEGVCAIRRRDDVDPIMQRLDSIENVVIIGGGYIGLEAAAVMRKLGKHVVVLEALDRVLARVAGEQLSRFYEAEHRAQGVDLRTNVNVDSFATEQGRVSAVLLADGESIPADLVIVGIGIIPEVQPLVEAGAAASNGVEVDEYCRSSLPDIYAVGDCALHTNRFADGASIRLESVQNANDQAKTAVQHIVGKAAAYEALPWFWSNQYDLKLQTAGLSTGHDQVVIRGDISSRSFSVVYLKAGRFIAIDAVNAPKEFAQAKAHITAGNSPDLEQLANAELSLKELLPSE